MNLEGAEAALALAPIAFAAGFIQGLTGFGSALVSIPLATFFVPLPFALAVFAVVDFANGLRLGLENPKNAILGDVARMVPLMIVGIVTGTTLLVNLPRNASLIALGAFVLAYAIYSLSRRAAAATAIPAGLFAVYIASRVFRVISREMVMRAVGILLLASGASLIARGLG